MKKKAAGARGVLAYFRRAAFPFELLTMATGALCARVCLRGMISPFAAAFVAAVSMTGLNANYALVGALLGCLLLQRPMNIAAAAVCLLYYLLNLLWGRWRSHVERFDRLALLFLAEVALLPVFFSGGLERLLHGLIALAAAVFGSLVMQGALRTIIHLSKRHVLSDGEQIGISAFLASF